MHLSDCFMEVFAYVTYFLRSVEAIQPGFEQVKGDVRQLLKESEGFMGRGGLSRDDYDSARFAVCAWVDEAILRSPWQEKGFWLKDQLQRVYYNTTDAGEEFFERLTALGFHQREAREVYYLCLALGFTGRYCHPGDEYQLEQIRTSNLKLLLGSSVGLPSLERADLFPEAYPITSADPAVRRRRFRFNLVTAFCLAAPVLLFAVLYLVYRFTLGGVGENFLRTVAN
jgi:type VI secretion system protein ImpK